MIVVSEVIATECNSPVLTDLKNSYSIDIKVTEKEIDGFGHVNNANYIQWLDQVHWSHLDYMGISSSDITNSNCGFVVHHTEVTYHAPLIENEIVKVGTSIISFDGNFRLTRKFQLLRLRDNTTVLSGEIRYVSIDLTTGRPKRAPQHYVGKISPHLPPQN